MRMTTFFCSTTAIVCFAVSGATQGQTFAPQQPAQGQQQPQRAEQSQQEKEDALAIVNGDVITKKEFQLRLKPHMESNPGLDAQTQQILKNQVMDGLIKEKLVDQYVAEKVPKPAKEEVKAVVDQVQKQAEAQGASYEQFLEAQGQTKKGMEKRIESSIAWQKFLEEQVSEPKLQQYFSQNQEKFGGQEYEQVRPQVMQSYSMDLWQQVAEQAMPEAEIEVVNPPAQPGAQQQRQQPQGSGLQTPQQRQQQQQQR